MSSARSLAARGHFRVLGPMLVLGLALCGAPRLKAAEAGIEVSDAWVRPSIAASTTTAAYVTLRNRGANVDRLIVVRSEQAQRVEMHIHIMDGDIARMRPAGPIEVAPGKTISFNPGGLHLMVLGLKQPLKAGESLPLTLVFEGAGEIKITAAARTSAPTAMPDMAGHHHH